MVLSLHTGSFKSAPNYPARILPSRYRRQKEEHMQHIAIVVPPAIAHADLQELVARARHRLQVAKQEGMPELLCTELLAELDDAHATLRVLSSSPHVTPTTC